MRNNLRYIAGLLTMLLLFNPRPVWAAGPPEPSVFSNPLAVTLLVLMMVLLVIIGILANIMIGAADVKLKKRLAAKNAKPLATLALLLLASTVFGQDTAAAPKAAKTIAGMEASTFYIMVSVLFLELLVIIGMLLNIRFLLKQEKERVAAPITEEEKIVAEQEKANRLSWWDRKNMKHRWQKQNKKYRNT